MAIFLGSLFVLFFVVRAIGLLARRRADVTSPGGIAHVLTSGPSRQHVVRYGAGRYAWNPALELGLENRLHGPAVATYTLDAAGTVNLAFVPERGEARNYSGPLPVGASEPDPLPPLGQRLAAPAVAILAFVAGYALDSGSIVVGSLLGMAGWFVASVVLMSMNSLTHNRAFAAARAK